MTTGKQNVVGQRLMTTPGLEFPEHLEKFECRLGVPKGTCSQAADLRLSFFYDI